MKFGRSFRKAKVAAPDDAVTASPDANSDAVGEATEEVTVLAPRDVTEVDLDTDEVTRVDLTSLLIAPAEGLELRLQVNEDDGAVQSVMLAGPDGAVELRAFAASRGGDMWNDVRRQIAAETSRQGGTATEREGVHGTELFCEMTVRTADGRTGLQPTRVAGFNGPRWFLRATYLGRAAVEPQAAVQWEQAVGNLVVRRGDGPMAPGDPLPITLPPQAKRLEQPTE